MQQQKNGVFYATRAATLAMQRGGKHVSTTLEGLRFLRSPYRGVIFRKSGATQARKIGIISFVKPVLTEDLYIEQKEEFSATCSTCDIYI
jgi:hypothetical protein